MSRSPGGATERKRFLSPPGLRVVLGRVPGVALGLRPALYPGLPSVAPPGLQSTTEELVASVTWRGRQLFLATSPTETGEVAKKVGDLATFFGDLAKWVTVRVGDLGGLDHSVTTG